MRTCFLTLLLLFGFSQVKSQTKAVYGKDTSTSSASGVLFDNGADTGNYSVSNNSSFFRIQNCSATVVHAHFTQLKFAKGNGKIHLYDGTDTLGKRLSPTDGITYKNQVNWLSKNINATSGSLTVVFTAQAGSSDSGFALRWEIETDIQKKPGTSFYTACDTVYTGNEISFLGTVTSPIKQIAWEYFDPSNAGLSLNKIYNHTFTLAGTETLCLTAKTCLGADTFCKNLQVVDVTDTVNIDCIVSDPSPEIGKEVQLISHSCQASNYEWQILPSHFMLVSGSSLNAKNPKIIFLKDTCYTISLTAWNAIAGKKNSVKTITKPAFICAKSYSIGTVTGKVKSYVPLQISIYDPQFSDTLQFHRDSLKTYELLGAQKPLIAYCSQPNFIHIRPKSITDTIQFSIWLDKNRNGKFNDPGEAQTVNGTIYQEDIQFTSNLVSTHSLLSLYGESRMRIAFSSLQSTINPDSIIGDGSFTDIVFVNGRHLAAPTIHTIYKDTITLYNKQVGTLCFNPIIGTDIWAEDQFEGNLNQNIIINTNVNCEISGTYYYNISVCNCAGFCANKTLIVQYYFDTLAPTISLNTADTICHEIYTEYTPVTPTITDPPHSPSDVQLQYAATILVNQKGLYSESYIATDKAGNKTTKTRYVLVDTCNKTNRYETPLEIPFTVYPNPASSSLILKSTQPCVATFFNIAGKQIVRINLNELSAYESINTATWEDGIYTMLYKSDTHYSIHKIIFIH